MNYHKNNLKHIQIKIGLAKDQEGIATGCLIAIIAFILIFVAIGVFVARNYQTWLADGITAAMHAVIEKSDLPQDDKSQISDIIVQIKDGYLAGEISIAELGSILDSLAECPAIPMGLVLQFKESYVVASGLSDAEKTAADLNLNRLARGLSGGQIDWEIVDEILAPISEPNDEGNQRLKSPAEVSDDEIREVILTVKTAADQAGISQEKVEIDISEEFKKSVEAALGRSIT
ncbi:MAG: hypothetical protein JSW26_06080 [Desulfobacterales bacterium]|nr:MAG: hypothetical protein JSW26_06080 [Desulfobacterales bacterium]